MFNSSRGQGYYPQSQDTLNDAFDAQLQDSHVYFGAGDDEEEEIEQMLYPSGSDVEEFEDGEEGDDEEDEEDEEGEEGNESLSGDEFDDDENPKRKKKTKKSTKPVPKQTFRAPAGFAASITSGARRPQDFGRSAGVRERTRAMQGSVAATAGIRVRGAISSGNPGAESQLCSLECLNVHSPDHIGQLRLQLRYFFQTARVTPL